MGAKPCRVDGLLWIISGGHPDPSRQQPTKGIVGIVLTRRFCRVFPSELSIFTLRPHKKNKLPKSKKQTKRDVTSPCFTRRDLRLGLASPWTSLPRGLARSCHKVVVRRDKPPTRQLLSCGAAVGCLTWATYATKKHLSSMDSCLVQCTDEANVPFLTRDMTASKELYLVCDHFLSVESRLGYMPAPAWSLQPLKLRDHCPVQWLLPSPFQTSPNFNLSIASLQNLQTPWEQLWEIVS